MGGARVERMVGRMLKNQWYAVEFVSSVGAAPHKVQVMGQDLVLYRTSRGECRPQ